MHIFRTPFPKNTSGRLLLDSIARSMRKKYEEELTQALQEKRTPTTTITSKERSRPLMLGDLDYMVQNYLKVLFFCIILLGIFHCREIFCIDKA